MLSLQSLTSGSSSQPINRSLSCFRTFFAHFLPLSLQWWEALDSFWRSTSTTWIWKGTVSFSSHSLILYRDSRTEGDRRIIIVDDESLHW